MSSEGALSHVGVMRIDDSREVSSTYTVCAMLSLNGNRIREILQSSNHFLTNCVCETERENSRQILLPIPKVEKLMKK